MKIDKFKDKQSSLSKELSDLRDEEEVLSNKIKAANKRAKEL